MTKFLYPETNTNPLSFSLLDREITVYPGKSVELSENDPYIKRLVALDVLVPIEEKELDKKEAEKQITSEEEQS